MRGGQRRLAGCRDARDNAREPNPESRVHYLILLLAIVCEVVATSALKASDGFRVPGPTALVLVGYGAAFYLLSLTLRTLPVGIAYAIWSGVGQVLVLLVAWWLYGQTLDVPAIVGIALILVGVIVLALFSSSMPH